jgi:nucleoid DNA-binding protein
MKTLNFNIERHLFHLLFQEDTIDIPGFGRIEVQSFDAEIQSQSGLCLPPSRRLTFSPISKKSQVLLNHLVRYEGLTYDSATKILEETTRNWKSELNQGKRLRLEGIGSFSKTGLQWVFQASVEANFLPEAFGLPIFRVNSLSIGNPISKEPKYNFEEESALNRKGKEKLLRPLRTAAVMIGIVSLLALGTTKDDYREMIQNASFKPNWESIQNQINYLVNFSPNSTSKKGSLPTQTMQDIYQDIEIDVLKKKAKNNSLKKIHSDKSLQTKTFSLVVGAFADINNAERLAKSLKSDGFPASLIKKEGELTKVSILNFTDKANAQSKKLSLTERFPGVWIYSQ